MDRSCAVRLLGVGLALAWACVAAAQGPAPAPKGAPGPRVTASFDVLKGNWLRPDGGYTIAITGIDANGELAAMYFNPKPLPFATARATREGAALTLFFELRAGGYGGSTYELTYDPGSDRLKGIYYQAVAKQRFDVYFVRK